MYVLHPKGLLVSTDAWFIFRLRIFHKIVISFYANIYSCVSIFVWRLSSRYLHKCRQISDVHTAVHRNIISTVKPTRCTNVSNLFYFGMTLYMFRTVFPSIISSSKTVHTATDICQTDTAVCLLEAVTCCCIYSLELLMIDGKTARNM